MNFIGVLPPLYQFYWNAQTFKLEQKEKKLKMNTELAVITLVVGTEKKSIYRITEGDYTL